jgi:valyl-tRNA synthetase
VDKRVSGMMQPHLAKKIEQATRKQFPEGIPSFGTDAFRFTFASLASTGRDIRFDLARTEGYRNFCNKLWNAARYVLMNTETQDVGLLNGVCEYTQVDHWIVSRLNQVIASTSQAIETYRFDLAAQLLYDFTWNEYCDWYLELTKVALQSNNEALQRGTRKTLLTVLETVLRLLHPLMPFITEEIWQRVAPLVGIVAPTIMLQPYPKMDESLISQIAITEIDWLMKFVLGVRKIRGEMNIAPGKLLPVLVQNGSIRDKLSLAHHSLYLEKIARLESIHWLASEEIAPESAMALVGEMKILIPIAGLIDKAAELARLEKEMQKIHKELPRIIGKLNNLGFVDKAPEAVLENEKAKLAALESSLVNLEQQFNKIKAL